MVSVITAVTARPMGYIASSDGEFFEGISPRENERTLQCAVERLCISIDGSPCDGCLFQSSHIQYLGLVDMQAGPAIGLDAELTSWCFSRDLSL